MAFQSTTQGFIESRNPCHQHTRYFCSQKILKRGDRIKGLKLRRINTYCSCHSTRGAAVHEVEKKSLACTAACLLRLPQYTRDSFFYLVSHVLRCHSTRDTVAPQIAVVGRIQLAAAPQLVPFYTIPNKSSGSRTHHFQAYFHWHFCQYCTYVSIRSQIKLFTVKIGVHSINPFQ